tara:strand:+ start:99 stop:752 length:654 start_codon:yes stop_codon:yes gene_type:complete
MGMLSILGKTEHKEFINFLSKEKAKVHVQSLSKDGIVFKEVSDIDEKPSIVTLLTNMKIILQSNRVRKIGFNIVDMLDLLKYFTNIIGIGDKFVELEDKYGCTMVMDKEDNTKPFIFKTDWIETENFKPQMADKAHADKIREISSEDEFIFYVFMKLDDHEKQQPVVMSWSKDNVDLFNTKLQELLASVEKISSHKIIMTMNPRENKNAIITSVKAV